MKRTRAAVLLTALTGVLALPAAVPAQAAPAARVGSAAPGSYYPGCAEKAYTVSPSQSGPTGGFYPPKPANSCLDLNLVNADNGQGVRNDCYAGWYHTSTGWHRGAVGFVCKPNAPRFGSPVVLVLNIATGTPIGVSSLYYNASVVIDY